MEQMRNHLAKQALKDIVEYLNLDPKLKDNCTLIGYIERAMKIESQGIR